MQQHGLTDFAMNFIDDIVIWSRIIEEHIQHIKLVLAALTSVRLTINPDKCYLFMSKLPLLGMVISIKGLQLNYEKIMNIMD